MKKYLQIYSKLFLFSVKSKLSYRLNLIFKIFHGPVYVGVLLCILLIAFQQTDTLGGWTKSEALTLFAVFNTIYSTCLILFMDSIRYLLWSAIRLGEVDTWLLKPGSAQFYLTFSRPNIDMIFLWFSAVGFFLYKLFTIEPISFWNFVGFWVVFVLAHFIIYFTLSIYATLGFFVTRAQQIVEVFDKASDFSQYPFTIFPQSLQLVLTTFLPIAFYSYVPTLFLRNQGSIFWIASSIALTLALYVINHFAWIHALKHYSSASS